MSREATPSISSKPSTLKAGKGNDLTASVAGSELKLSVNLVWDKSTYVGGAKDENIPNVHRRHMISSCVGNVVIDGKPFYVSLNISEDADIPQTAKQRRQAENDALRAELAELRAEKAKASALAKVGK